MSDAALIEHMEFVVRALENSEPKKRSAIALIEHKKALRLATDILARARSTPGSIHVTALPGCTVVRT